MAEAPFVALDIETDSTIEADQQGPILDVVTEGVHADFIGRELHFGGPDQPAGIVHQPHRPQRG